MDVLRSNPVDFFYGFFKNRERKEYLLSFFDLMLSDQLVYPPHGRHVSTAHGSQLGIAHGAHVGTRLTVAIF